jgi:hypothetical protein
MKATKTHGEIEKIVDVLNRYLMMVDKNANYLPVKKANTLIRKITKQHNELKAEKLTELRENNCLLGEKKEILTDEKGNMIFTPEGSKAVREGYKKFLATTIEVDYNEQLNFSDLEDCLPESIKGIMPEIDDEEKDLLSPFYLFND